MDKVFKLNTVSKIISLLYILFKRPLIKYVLVLAYVQMQLQHAGLPLEHVYVRPEVNSNWFEISNHLEMLFRLHGNSHGDFTAATFQTIARLYHTCANDIF